jgi:hypothetical protein
MDFSVWNWSSNQLAKVIDVNVKLTTQDEFGDIRGGKLVLEAPSRHFELVLEDDV